jgi:hypothetical protein
MAVVPEVADSLVQRLEADGYAAAIVGSVREGNGLMVEA